jgi:hypothetical protein
MPRRPPPFEDRIVGLQGPRLTERRAKAEGFQVWFKTGMKPCRRPGTVEHGSWRRSVDLSLIQRTETRA